MAPLPTASVGSSSYDREYAKAINEGRPTARATPPLSASPTLRIRDDYPAMHALHIELPASDIAVCAHTRSCAHLLSRPGD